MLQVASLAPRLLGESAALVKDFLLSCLNADGGFKNRSGDSDLYYSVFGIDGLLALRCEPPAAGLRRYLESFGDGGGLDLVHLSCLTRCWAALSREGVPPRLRPALRKRLDAFKCAGGGYHNQSGQECGTLYGCFMALGLTQDLEQAFQAAEVEELHGFVSSLSTPDGAYANDRHLQVGATPATAAALTLLRNLKLPQPAAAGDWLKARYHKQGGFLAFAAAPMPDLLSTATALHALAGLGETLEDIQDSCLDYIDTLWTNGGGFHGHWADGAIDCEYTYYGLLALGHLSF